MYVSLLLLKKTYTNHFFFFLENKATVSLLISTVVNSVIKVNPGISPSEIAVTVGLFTGIISVAISLLRLGILVDFIPGKA